MSLLLYFLYLDCPSETCAVWYVRVVCLCVHPLWQDWVWSVGCNPFSVTSQGWHISSFHSDSIARSYIFTALEESIQLVNSAIHLLVVERTSILAIRWLHLHIAKLLLSPSNVLPYEKIFWRLLNYILWRSFYLGLALEGICNYVDHIVHLGWICSEKTIIL